MTGPEHYLEAARLLAAVGEGSVPVAMYALRIAQAQAHATLAHAAAQAAAAMEPYLELDDTAAAWAQVLG